MKELLNFLVVGLLLAQMFNVVFVTASHIFSLTEQRYKRNSYKSIIDEPKCSQIKMLCGNLNEHDDIHILECLQSLNPTILNLESDCKQVIWNHTADLIKNENVDKMLRTKNCEELQKLNCKVDGIYGSYLKCIITVRDDIKNAECNNAILQLKNVAFQDLHWIPNFLDHCKDDIDKLNCGEYDPLSLGQSNTIACLQDRILSVKDTCKEQVFKLSELQADNIRLDRQLYLSCINDHIKFCHQFPAGSGRIFTCLMSQQTERLSKQCQDQLLRRQKLIMQDYRVSKGLMRACKDDIRKNHCRKQTSNNKATRLAQILLCLENVVKNGSRIDSDCEAEMVDHRKMLMEDYRLSPEIVDKCKNEISNFCYGLDVGGKTIHCLMEHARLKNAKKRISDICQRSLEELVKETDAGEDWRVDSVLHQACNPVVQTVCRGVKGGDSRVMSCLMDNIETDHMTEDCEEALIQIQYFVARDFKLDSQLYRACKEDAANICHTSQSWDNSLNNQPSYSPRVLPCLYRNAPKVQIKKACLQQIQRVMRQRAISVDLQPEIEEACLNDLGLFCSDKTKKGEEVLCLQKNLEELRDPCREAVEHFTEIEAQHAELNPYISTNCRKEMDTLCNIELKHDDGDVMECLIVHKNDPIVKNNPPCRASIEHFQIISLKDYRFTYKFKLACKNFAMRFCSKAKTKSEVVQCLSEKVTNDTVRGFKSDVPKECRQQLKAQLFQQRENIDLNPKLKNVCAHDIKNYCSKIEHGNAQVLECLQTTREKLTPECEHEVFKLKKQEIYDNSVDYALLTMCADAIEQFCPHREKETILECLKLNRNQKGFSKKCYVIVQHRMIEQDTNYQLNPLLQENCKMDINKFCLKDIAKHKQTKNLNDVVINCLKVSFRKSNLSHKCENQLISLLREQALDVNLNPLMRVMCKNELETICKSPDDDSIKIEECLKNALIEKKIATPECQVEVANMIEESQVDIQVDPLLQQVCALDLLKYCNTVPQGHGRHIKCLRIKLEEDPKQLFSDCRNMLTQRLTMYENAAHFGPPENIPEFYYQVANSPARHSFIFVFFVMFASIFMFGIFFGRTFKRHITLKNK